MFMKKSILSICFLTFLFVVCAQNYNAVLFKVGSESVTANEFINTFNKNNSLENATENELKDYLELYINFKLKVMDGIDYKIDTALSFQRELASYKYQSAQPYLVDKEVTEKLINEAVERSKLMVRASHILILCEPNALPKDTLTAYLKILDIRKKILSGTITFPEAAVQFSEDVSARDEVNRDKKIQFGNKGDLGYFSAFDLIYPFESAAYNTPVGDCSMPVRTQFGYHIIWVQDKQPAVSKINISQILLLDTTARFGSMSPKVKEKLERIEDAFKSEKDFASIAEVYTEDPMSKSRGGMLESFPPARRPGDFIKQCISLEKGQVSPAFSSVVGWHIVKLNELTMLEVKDDELRYSVISKIQRDTRSTKSVESLIEKLKKEYKFSDKGKNEAFNFLLKKLNTETIMPPATNLLAMAGIEKLKPMANLADQTITIQDFIKHLDRSSGIELNKQAKSFLDANYEEFIKDAILKYEFEHLEQKYPEYKELISEYHQGMILFEMTNEKIWSLSLKDTVNLESFYEKIKFDHLNKEGEPKPFAEIRSIVLTEYQNELETKWMAQLKEKYPVWINEELFNLISKKNK